MTYGEYWISIKMSLNMVDGEWTTFKPVNKPPKRMRRKDASSYYKKKFNDYWLQNSQKI